MKNLRVGVVGVGHIGKNHARLYAETEAVDFAAIYDTDAATARAIAQQYEVRATNSLAEFSELIDAASVATPTNSHFAIAQPLLEKGKHLLIEKPIAENTTEASQLAELAVQRQLVLQVGHVERFNPVLSALEASDPSALHRSASPSPFPNRSTDMVSCSIS